jgi:hypothetical protein
MCGHFIPFRGRAEGPAGLLIAVNPSNISHISSCWDKKLKQNMLRIHLNNGRQVAVFEAGAEDVLEALGLEEFVGDWVLTLETDIG